jgi:S-adenosylmethionine:tRNA ribosyltransferase-isomerase
MRAELFDYDLPDELIARRPPKERDGGRLCILEREAIRHAKVASFESEVRPGDLIILNETRVRRARLLCRRPRTQQGGGGKVELLFLRPLTEGRWEALGRASRPLRVGDELETDRLGMSIAAKTDSGSLEIEIRGDLEAALAQEGAMPIPPYLGRDADEEDVHRYQTVFARHLGSAAAPTAGLHLSEALLKRLENRGAQLERVVLHVGVGTFRPVSAEDLDDHAMHSEFLSVSEGAAQAIACARRTGGRVIAIGTTVVRALESAADPDQLGLVRPMRGQTDLLIQPGYRFRVVDALWTNFHQPRSTLLALVSAFAGHERTLEAYQTALRERYRFLSYGDAMWIPHAWGDPSKAAGLVGK